MILSINNLNGIFQPQIFQQNSPKDAPSQLGNFEEEDQAIISAEANMQYELEKFNSGADNLVELALSNVMARITTGAEVNAINVEKDMMDEVLKIGT